MVDNVKDIPETADNKATLDALDRARLARERREVEQRKRLDELHVQAAAAQAQRERRDDERRRRQQEQRARDDERRHQVEERKRAIWEASVSRREALLQRDRERTERLERARASRSSPRSAFAFGSSTPRLLEPVDSAGFFWAARSTNPIDQINFFESFKPEAASTTNVMMASAPLSMHASSTLFTSDNKDKDENERSPQPAAWSSVARRRTDLVPTLPASRAPEWRSGETTPGSRPSSALSNAAGVVRRGTPARRPRPVSIAGTGVNTPRGGTDCGLSLPSTPSVSRDSTVVVAATPPSGEVPRRPQSTPRRPRPLSAHGAVKNVVAPPANPADGKPPLQRKPKPSKEVDKASSLSASGKSSSASPRAISPAPAPAPAPIVAKLEAGEDESASANKSPVSAIEVTQKLVALQVRNGDERPVGNQNVDKENETKPIIEALTEVTKPEQKTVDDKPAEPQKPEPKPADAQKPVEKKEEKVVVKEEKREQSQEKIEEVDMTGSMTGRRITTEEEAKAALAERRRKAREELEKQAELERQRLLREAQEEEERQRLEEERQRREEVEARELARLQRAMEEEKLRKAIEAQQQLEREEAERKAREEVERQARLREDEGKRKAAEEAERLRREEAEREEKERLARKQRVEAIMARTRLRKAEEDKKQQEGKAQPAAAEPAPAAHPDNGNAVTTGDLLGFGTSQPDESSAPNEAVANNAAPAEPKPTPNNGNVTADLLGMSDENNTEDKTMEQSTVASKQIDNSAVAAPAPETNNGNVHLPEPTVGHISANFIQTERSASEHSQKLPETMSKLIEDDFTAHNGHGANHDKPLTLTMQN